MSRTCLDCLMHPLYTPFLNFFIRSVFLTSPFSLSVFSQYVQHVDKSAVTCSVSPDGVLTIKAPKLAQGNGSQERIVPITQETS